MTGRAPTSAPASRRPARSGPTRTGLALALLLATALSGCSQGRESFVVKVLETAVDQLTQEEAEAVALPSRARLERIQRPVISIKFADNANTGFASAVNANSDAYVTYQDRTRRSVILRGGMVTGLQGFGYDMSSIKTQPDDPVVRRTPVADWPQTLVRNYQFSLQRAKDFEVTVTCTLRAVVREKIEIIERNYDVTRVQEVCSNDRRTFTNTYWVDTNSGFIWQSEQWVGPRQKPMTIQVIRPFGPT